MADRDLHRPDGAVRAVGVVLHPHPAMGGDRHHPLVVALASGLAAQGIAALRLDLTDPDPLAAAPRLEAIAADLAAEEGVERLHLLGYSWGSVVSALAAPAGLVSRVLVAPPVSMLTMRAGHDDVPQLVLVPAHDQYGPPDAVREVLGGRAGTAIEVVDGCDHFLVGAVARIAGRAVAWLSSS